MFELDEEIHGVKAESIDRGKVTRSAIASLRLAIKAYFETYYICHKKNIIVGLDEANPFNEVDMKNVDQLCNDLEYQEKYMQCIFHFHHFFELFLKDILVSVHPGLALKVTLDGSDANQILYILSREGNVDLFQDNTVEFDLSMKRIISLLASGSQVPIVAKTIYDYKKTLITLNRLRNKAWHKGIYLLRITELDQFVGQNIFPLVLECLRKAQYARVEHYWKYSKTSVDPIQKIIAAANKTPVDYRQIAFYKAYGLACYTNPESVINLDIDDTELKARAIADSLHELHVDDCFLCGATTLLVSTESDFDTDREGNYLGGWWNTTSAECLNCRLLLYPDVGDPINYGLSQRSLWESGNYE